MTGTRLLVICLAAAAAALPVEAWAHGANFKDPSDSPKRSARPSPMAPAPPGVTTETARGIPPVWKPEGWYRWWELNAVGLTPRRRAAAPKPLPVTTGGNGPAAKAPPGDLERARLITLLLRLAEPERNTGRRLLASVLVTLGRIAVDERPVVVLRRWAVNRPAGAQIRDAALLGLGLLRRDDPSDRLHAIHLHSLRQFLLERADDSQEPVRTRAYAILSLGLLADQGHADTPLARDGRDVTRAIWQRLPQSHSSSELSIAWLGALGLQPAAGVPVGVVEGLKGIALGERVRGRRWDPYERSHAVTALARLGKAGCDAFLLRMAMDTRQHEAIRAATAIATMARAGAMDAQTRVACMRALTKSAEAPGTDWLVRALDQLAIGTLLGEDLRAGCEVNDERKLYARRLRGNALDGPREARPFCALAVGMAIREQRKLSDPGRDIVFFARRSLRIGLEHAGRSERMLGAFALALGLARDPLARDPLLERLRERERDGVFRGQCALALGLIGPADLTNGTALLAATRERTHVFLHLQAARALGILGTPDAPGKLLRRFDAADTPSVTAGLALGLATLGDRGAVPSLFKRFAEEDQPVGVRVNCLIALGALLDPDPGSSAARMTMNANYTALPGGYRRYLDLL